jgi:radical SAM superfamily enzyme YgiQ (UPF0313 family)
LRTAAPHILLVNPWIHDFAAYDFWAAPLGLLAMAALLRDRGFRVSYYDCLDRYHPRAPSRPPGGRSGRGPYAKTPLPNPPGLEDVPRRYCRYGTPKEWVEADLAGMPPPDLVLVTSFMTYWYPGVIETVRVLRRRWPRVRILLGGVYATLCTEHAAARCDADRVVSGYAGAGIVDIAAEETGFDAAPPAEDLDAQPYPAFDLQLRLPHVPLLTSTGCPFDCAYCASPLLSPGRWRRSPDRVVSEVAHWHRRRGVADFAFYDDALLADSGRHAVPLLEGLARAGLPVRFHTPNALHIREITPALARLMRRAGFRTVRLGLETAGPRALDRKTSSEQFEAAAAALREAGFGPGELGAYLLAGLPDQPFAALVRSFRTVKRAGVTPIAAYYSPIPGTRLWPDAVRASRYDLESDPIFTNNAVLPCRREGFSWSFLRRLKALAAG